MVTSERSSRLDNGSGMARVIPAAYWLRAFRIRSWLAMHVQHEVDPSIQPRFLSAYSIRPVNMRIANMRDLERCPSRRREHFGFLWSGFRKQYGVLVNGRRPTQTEKDVAKLRCRLSSNRY